MRGVWTALITPFDDDYELDLQTYRKILNDQVDAKVTGVVVCGTTGESPTLNHEEKKILIQTTVTELKGTGVKVLAGTGTNDTAETRELSIWAAHQGVDGLLLVTPYYNRPSQGGLEAHFREIAQSVNCEIMLYNVPTRTGVTLSAETIVRLAEYSNIRSLKEATGSVISVSEIINRLSATQRSVDILSGDDSTYLPFFSVGATGVVSVASNLFPRKMVELYRSLSAGHYPEALKLHRHYFPLFRDFFIETNPVPIKYAMAWAGQCKNRVRLPLSPLCIENQTILNQSLMQCGIVPGSPL